MVATSDWRRVDVVQMQVQLCIPCAGTGSKYGVGLYRALRWHNGCKHSITDERHMPKQHKHKLAQHAADTASGDCCAAARMLC